MFKLFDSIREAKDYARSHAIEDGERWYISYGARTTTPNGTEPNPKMTWAVSHLSWNTKTLRADLKDNVLLYYTPEGLEVRLDGEEDGMREIVLSNEQWELVRNMLDLKDDDLELTEVEQELKDKLDA